VAAAAKLRMSKDGRSPPASTGTSMQMAAGIGIIMATAKTVMDTVIDDPDTSLPC
jgi:hypothetical protein